MSQQQRLFDNPEKFRTTEPLARNSDEETSHLAAFELTMSGKRDTQKAKLYRWMAANSSERTASEVAKDSGFSHDMVHKRLPDLLRDGYVEKCPARECRVTGSQAVTWKAKT